MVVLYCFDTMLSLKVCLGYSKFNTKLISFYLSKKKIIAIASFFFPSISNVFMVHVVTHTCIALFSVVSKSVNLSGALCGL